MQTCTEHFEGYGSLTTHTDPAGSSTGFSVPKEKMGLGGDEGWMCGSTVTRTGPSGVHTYNRISWAT